jgi:hypothetical protein
VTGPCNLDGNPWVNTFGTKGTNTDASRNLPTIWAPGFTDMSCATGLVGQDPLFIATDGGTSEAAVSVAGIAAYFLGLTSLPSQVIAPAKLKAFIKTTAIPRGPVDKQLPCTYNGILFAQVQANPQCPVVARDGILSNGCAAISSNIPSSPSNSSLMSTPSVPTTFSTVDPRK